MLAQHKGLNSVLGGLKAMLDEASSVAADITSHMAEAKTNTLTARQISEEVRAFNAEFRGIVGQVTNGGPVDDAGAK